MGNNELQLVALLFSRNIFINVLSYIKLLQCNQSKWNFMITPFPVGDILVHSFAVLNCYPIWQVFMSRQSTTIITFHPGEHIWKRLATVLRKQNKINSCEWKWFTYNIYFSSGPDLGLLGDTTFLAMYCLLIHGENFTDDQYTKHSQKCRTNRTQPEEYPAVLFVYQFYFHAVSSTSTVHGLVHLNNS